MTYRKWLTTVVVFLAAILSSNLSLAGIANTKHNLSVTGPGSYKATSESQLCIYCHAPHNANPASPLWNHALSSATYTPYFSKTLAAAAPGQPTGSSKLCLTCHDGTVALGSVQHRPNGQGPGVIAGLTSVLLGTSLADLTTDLRNDHPVSFAYDAALAAKNLELASPASLTGKIKPEGGQLQCASCHNPHSDVNPKFLHLGFKDAGGYGSPLCRTCHQKQYWNTVPSMPHRESLAKWNGTGTNPWHIPGQNLANDANSTPKANGCESCHDAHSGTGPNRILKQDGESGVCLVCHNGNVAAPAKSIDATLNALYTHPVKTYAGRHDPKRQADGKVREDQTALANRHAECEDCHNPHAVSAGVSPTLPAATNNLASKVLKGVWGVQPNWPGNFGTIPQTGGYTVVDDIQYQYQLCLKCHSSYAFGATPPPEPYGKGVLTDIAQEFNPNNASYHPVVQQGRNPYRMGSTYMTPGTSTSYATALVNGFTPTSTMTCADCHDNATGTAGPKGPHGSAYWPILSAPWDATTGKGSASHLCFQCHNAATYGAEGSDGGSSRWGGGWGDSGTGSAAGTGYSTPRGMNLHQFHVGGRGLKCQTCHAAVPHGWKRPHMLIFGVGPERDKAPYNGHYDQQVGIPTDFGNGQVTLETVKSGQYQCGYCHGTALGVNSGGSWGGR